MGRGVVVVVVVVEGMITWVCDFAIVRVIVGMCGIGFGSNVAETVISFMTALEIVAEIVR